METFEQQLVALTTELKTYFQKAEIQQREHGTITTELKTKISELQTKFDNVQRQADGIDSRLAGRHTGAPQDTLENTLKENDRLQDFLKHRSGVCSIQIAGKHVAELLERKTLIDTSALGSMTSGVLQIDRTPGIVQEARQELRLRDVLTTRPTGLSQIDYVKVNSAPSAASLQTEGSAKSENAVTFTTASAYVKTIASWLPCTRQALSDFAELMGYIQNALPYYVKLREEIEFLHGGGGSTDINGLVTQATPFNTALLPAGAGWNKSDQVAAAIQQVEVAKEIQPTFVVLHPTDYWQILRTKDANRNYLFGSNNSQTDPFWGLKPVRTTNMGAGNFLVGSGNPVACEIRDRMELELAISQEHSTFFIENKVALRGESRVALVVYRPASFIFGSFTTSPA